MINKNIKEEYNVLTIKELCEFLNVSSTYAYQFIRENKIKYVKVGRKFYISKKSLDEYMQMAG